MSYTFTSESVSEGHPDKVCDFIADSILDDYLEQDPKSRVACEVLCKEDTAVIAGEITSEGTVNHAQIVLDAIRYVGDTDQRGFARVFGGTIDIGAFESNFTTPTPTPTPNPTVSPTPSPTPTPTPVCTYSLGTTGQTFTYTGGSGLIDVITQSGYAYTATNNDPFVTLSKSSGTGNGTINEDLLSSQLSE